MQDGLSEKIRERIGGYQFDFDERHVKCSAMRTVLNHLEFAHSPDDVTRLISILNSAIGENFFSREYIYNDMNWVSYEIYQSILEIAKELSMDPRFCYHAGLNFFKYNKGGIITLAKYLGSPKELYKKIPSFVNTLNSQINLNVVEVLDNRAIITMSLKPRFRKRAAHRRFFFKNGCDLVKGGLESIPTLYDFPKAEVADVTCLGNGDSCCEWRFVWKNSPFLKRYWQSLIARDYKQLMNEQNEELSNTIMQLERKYEELQEKNREILQYQAKLIEKEKLEIAVRILSELIHDLKTPLTMISGYAQLFKTGAIPPKDAKEYSELILSQSTRTVAIVQDLLNYLRGTPPSLHKEQTRVVDLIAGVYHEIKPGFEANNIRTNVELKGIDEASCFVDRENFRRAIYNICKNAKEAMPEGGSFIIEAKHNKDNIELAFKDTGVGIPQERQKDIFKRFVSSKKEGSGLGMWITKSIVEAHNGEIELKSRPSKGTAITIRIPTYNQNIKKPRLKLK